MDLHLEKSPSAGTGAVPVVAVQADSGVTATGPCRSGCTGKWCLQVELVGSSCVSHLVHLTPAAAPFLLCAGCDLVPVSSGNDPGQGLISIRQHPCQGPSCLFHRQLSIIHVKGLRVSFTDSFHSSTSRAFVSLLQTAFNHPCQGPSCLFHRQLSIIHVKGLPVSFTDSFQSSTSRAFLSLFTDSFHSSMSRAFVSLSQTAFIHPLQGPSCLFYRQLSIIHVKGLRVSFTDSFHSSMSRAFVSLSQTAFNHPRQGPSCLFHRQLSIIHVKGLRVSFTDSFHSSMSRAFVSLSQTAFNHPRQGPSCLFYRQLSIRVGGGP